jgi:diadenosine tetraphosphate (Ap4A) HIT family hydrolase
VKTLCKEDALAELEAHRQQLLGNDQSCVMCALAQGRAEPSPLLETEHAVVVLDRFAQRRGHLLVISKVHVEAVSQIGWELYLHIQRLVYDARLALDRALSPLQIYTGIFGATAPVPMSFAHFHVHVIPIFEDDERARPARVLSWSEGVVVYDELEAESLRDQIVKAWPSGTSRGSTTSEALGNFE